MQTTQIERQTNTPPYTGKRALDFSPFQAALEGSSPGRNAEIEGLVEGAAITEIQAARQQGRLSYAELALFSIERIRRLDVDALNTVIELNPEALQIADQMDAELSAGKIRSPLHGIPILIKDNIATADRTHTTAGAKALENARADRDAFIVHKLRQAGCVILGKANLSEWANFMTSSSANGFSVLGGQARNPRGRFDVGGSSSGSGAAVAAGLVPLAVGTETSGSLTSPASQNGIVTIKPSLGLVSRDRIIPITAEMDTAGPMARNLADLAALLNVLAGEDPADPASAGAASLFGLDFTRYLDPHGLRGLRIGIVQGKDDEPADQAALEAAAHTLQAAGAQAVNLELEPEFEKEKFLDVLGYGLQHGVTHYLQEVALDAGVRSLAEVIAFNQADLPNRAPFGQDRLERSQAVSLSENEAAGLAQELRGKAQVAIRGALAEQKLDLLLTLRSSFSYVYATAGFPALCVPGGRKPDGEPVGLTFVGDYLEDGKLIAAGRGWEAIKASE